MEHPFDVPLVFSGDSISPGTFIAGKPKKMEVFMSDKNFENYGLGRIPSPLDIRDYNLAAFMPLGIYKETGVVEKFWEYPKESLNQL